MFVAVVSAIRYVVFSVRGIECTLYFVLHVHVHRVSVGKSYGAALCPGSTRHSYPLYIHVLIISLVPGVTRLTCTQTLMPRIFIH